MTEICARIASVLLVDPQGRLLLQLRDGNTRIDPHRWCLPGSDIDPGEDPRLAALRELHEETGLKPDSDLDLFWCGVAASARFPGAMAEYFVYCGFTTAGPEDVQCFEGAAMQLVGADMVPGLEFGATYTHVVPRFLASARYRHLTKVAAEAATP